MKLITYLEQLTPSTLKKILNEHGKNLEGKSPNELVTELNHWLTQAENLQMVDQQMTKEEKEVLSYFIYQIPNQILPYRRLDKWPGSINRDQFEYGITKLRRKGMIFTLRRSWGELAFIIPEDLFQAWHRFYFRDVIEKITEISISSHAAQDSIQENLQEDMFRLLSYIQLEQVPITQKGTIHKRHISRMVAQLSINQALIAGFPFKQKYGSKAYPKQIGLLLEMGFSIGLIERITFLTVTKKAEAWHEMDFQNRMDYLMSSIRTIYDPSDIFLYHVFYFLFHLPKNRWFSFSHLVHHLAHKLKRPIGEEMLKRLEKEVILPLQAFGWLEQDKDLGKEWLIRWKKTEEEELKQLYVQPNYEILVPHTFPHYLRLTLEHFAVLHHRDQFNRYLLTKESMMKGLGNGLSRESILVFLEKYSAVPISDNVKTTMADWSKNYGTIAFLDVRILKCENETVATQVKQAPRLQEWIIGELNATHLIIKREKFDELLQYITQLGFYPKKEIWTEEKFYQAQVKEDEIEDVEWRRNKEYRIENLFPAFPSR